MRRFWILFAGVANLVFVDGLVKELVERTMTLGQSHSVIPGFFDIALVHNRGCAWGLFQGQVWPLAVFGLLALAFLVWKRRSVFGDAYLAPILLYAGIIGNVCDRLFRGYVVDMFDFHWGASHFPCFNVADSCICIAAGLMILLSFKNKPARKQAD